MDEGNGQSTVDGKSRTLTRRRFLGKAAGATAAAGAASVMLTAAAKSQVAPGTTPTADSEAAGYRAPTYQDVTLHVNGVDHALRVDTRMTLAEALREGLHLTGTKIPCDQGECGACTVVMDGKTVYSCSILAVAAQGHDILTIEGLELEQKGQLHPVQAAFIQHDAVQCGFCTSGQILSVYVLLKNNPKPDDAAVRQAIQGNLCRCGTYTHIIEAAKAAAAQARG